MHKGRLISFEGSEGCGKSTQIELLAESLRAAGKEVLALREPGGTYIGERLRHLLKYDEGAHNMCAQTELLLFAASRAQLVREVIAPALAGGTYVLCDRFLDSTTVYQGVARQLDAASVAAINTFAVGNVLPDLTFILDLPSGVGLQRAQARAAGTADRMEQEGCAFYETVREGYLLLAQNAARAQAPSRFAVINAQGLPEAIHQEVLAEVERRFSVSSTFPG